MRRLLLVPLAVAAACLAAPTAFGASGSRLTTVELASSGAPTIVSRFTLAGVQWRGAGEVAFRTRSVDGRWSRWRAGAPSDHDAPDLGSPERTRTGWTLGNPYWVGASDRIQARARGQVTSIRAKLVWSPGFRVPYRVPAATVAPPIVPRLSWGADESIRRAPPGYASGVRFAVVHHTAGRNDYSRAEAAAIVKGIQLYHVRGNGWNDIGYNFLVDRFGTVYEGRLGGIDRDVIGAHAQGFNTGSVGIALLGTYEQTRPSTAALDAIARLIAWRLDLEHVDPASFLTFISGGSNRYRSGIPVLLSAVTGHRDTGFTECPGDALEASLPELAGRARELGGLKIFEAKADAAESTVRVRARLSRSDAWAVVITSSSGAEIARGAGAGTDVDWTWDSAGTPAGQYTWTISAGSARPAVGILRAGGFAAPVAIEAVAAEPEAISPNGDGQADTTALTYRISAPANVSVEITDVAGALLATVVDRVWTRAGEHTVTVDGAALVDGNYNVVVTARTAAGVAVQKLIPLSVNRTLGLVAVTPMVFSPNADGRKDRITLTFGLATPADVRIRIEREGRWVASPLTASFLAGTQQLVWDGVRASGRLRDGEYSAVVEATGGVGPISFSVPFSSDTVAPRVRILPRKGVWVEVSEPSMLTFVIDGQALKREVKKAGIVRIPWAGPAPRVRVAAWDAAGNTSGPVVRARRTG